MLILLSPAKTMSGKTSVHTPETTLPLFQKEADMLALQMAQLPSDVLASTLKISPRLTAETFLRFQNFHSESVKALPALLAYTGVVFKNMQPEKFTADDFLFAQTHLRMVSVCYGLLRPLDLIKPYRMEYAVKLPELHEDSLYTFWRKRETLPLIEAVKADDGILINLASMDVQPAFHWDTLSTAIRIITPEFKVMKKGKAQTVVIYAKMARGRMSRFIIKNRLTDPEALKTFEWEGFRYNPALSSENNWIFVQE